MEDDEIKRCYVHVDLVNEFECRKEAYEKELGYAISGGIPVISKICAEILRKQRLKEKDPIKLEVTKLKGIKKSSLTFL